MFHKTLDPVVCHTPDDVKKLGPGWYTYYQFREYPKWVYGEEGMIKVQDRAEEDAKLAAGYSSIPLPEKPKMTTVATMAFPGKLDAETFQKIQILEFEVANHSEQINVLNGIVTELRAEQARQAELASEPVAVGAAAATEEVRQYGGKRKA